MSRWSKGRRDHRLRTGNGASELFEGGNCIEELSPGLCQLSLLTFFFMKQDPFPLSLLPMIPSFSITVTATTPIAELIDFH